jgi:hypothetical protein
MDARSFAEKTWRDGEVWFVGAMGLLDDAIREHLELKRRHGADPGEVTLEEREALSPALSMEGGLPAEDGAGATKLSTIREDRTASPVETRTDLGYPLEGQETVELDMRAILEEESIEDAGHSERDGLPSLKGTTPLRARVEPPVLERDPTGDSLEWEVPRERRRAVNRQLRGEGFPDVHGVLDASRAPTSGVSADVLDSVDAHESLWLDRQLMRDLSTER